jgi:hypothetical protein
MCCGRWPPRDETPSRSQNQDDLARAAAAHRLWQPLDQALCSGARTPHRARARQVQSLGEADREDDRFAVTDRDECVAHLAVDVRAVPLVEPRRRVELRM